MLKPDDEEADNIPVLSLSISVVSILDDYDDDEFEKAEPPTIDGHPDDDDDDEDEFMEIELDEQDEEEETKFD